MLILTPRRVPSYKHNTCLAHPDELVRQLRRKAGRMQQEAANTALCVDAQQLDDLWQIEEHFADGMCAVRTRYSEKS